MRTTMRRCCSHLPREDSVVNPIWLFTIRCILPPTLKWGHSAIQKVSATTPYKIYTKGELISKNTAVFQNIYSHVYTLNFHNIEAGYIPVYHTKLRLNIYPSRYLYNQNIKNLHVSWSRQNETWRFITFYLI